MELAALATAAVPGLTPAGVASIPDEPEDFDSAMIVDDANQRWRVRAPRHEEASMRLERELTVLHAFSPAVRAELPFLIPSVVGTIRQGALRTFVYNHVQGTHYDLDGMAILGESTAIQLGRALAAVHGLPDDVAERGDFPSYSAEEFRQRRLNELDQAAMTGKIPVTLLRRWEHALEDVNLWRFNPTLVHGDLHEESFLINDSRVVAISGWTDVHVGDPADDFAWLQACQDSAFVTSVMDAYVAERGEHADPHLSRRAALAAEFALAQWLSRSIASGDEESITEAQHMLEDLDKDIREFGGQPISVIEQPQMPAHSPTVSVLEDDDAASVSDETSSIAVVPVGDADVAADEEDSESVAESEPESEPESEDDSEESPVTISNEDSSEISVEEDEADPEASEPANAKDSDQR
ncbi:hypothetical protein GCM10009861_12690 [Neomicrococcus aestuarii]|jgi:aminoglycoside phosphotransferase (APT) family kinase protein